jgi:FkbM family methyltransferase
MLKIMKRIFNFLLTQKTKYVTGKKFELNTSNSKFHINTTYGHPLKTYLESMILYDRFLPYLIKNTKSGVIDVGSNIGDTLVLIKSKTDCKIVCVDPDPKFNLILNKNIKQNNFKEVLVYNYPISYNKRKVKIEKNNSLSTGNIKSSDKGIITKSINDLVIDLNLNLNDYRTIKIDTDGYDWDVLNSIADYCNYDSNNFDFIFYEHQTYLNNEGPNDKNREYREQKYFESLLKLRKLEFKNYFIFDNFGNFILKSADLDCLSQIVKYIRRSFKNRSTFDFIDVLICKDEGINIVEKTLEEYYTNDLKV